LAGSDTKPFRSAFEKAYPGVKLEIYRASGTTILQKILTENRAGTDVVDAVMTQVSALHPLKERQLLARFESDERKAFDARFKDREGYWTDVYPTVHSMPYNTKLVAPRDLPKHYTGLLDPKWKNRLALNRNNYMFVAALLDFYGKEKGRDFLRKLAHQEPQIRSGGTLTATLVGAGELPIAFSVNANNVENVKEKGSPVDWVRLEDPLYGEPHPASVMARAPHPNAARLLVEFAISREGQSLMSKLGKVPARGDIEPKIGVDRAKLRFLPAEEEARTAHYQKMFDDLFGKG
jgi:iron(III) transport system substrate-binding protein